MSMKTKDRCSKSGNIPGMFVKTKLVTVQIGNVYENKEVNVGLRPAALAL